jgi:hypothetical protein
MCCALHIFDFVCLFPRFLFDGGIMVNFGDDCSTILAFFAPGNNVDDAFSSWKMEVWL